MELVHVSVPSFGDSFFIMRVEYVYMYFTKKVSVPSFGDSFFIAQLLTATVRQDFSSFRPLIRGFFFYT